MKEPLIENTQVPSKNTIVIPVTSQAQAQPRKGRKVEYPTGQARSRRLKLARLKRSLRRHIFARLRQQFLKNAAQPRQKSGGSRKLTVPRRSAVGPRLYWPSPPLRGALRFPLAAALAGAKYVFEGSERWGEGRGILEKAQKRQRSFPTS